MLYMAYGTLIHTLVTVNLTKLIRFFKLCIDFDTLIVTILVLTTLRTAIKMAGTCRWLLRNKITFIHASAFVDRFKKFYTSDECPEHGTYKTKTICGKMKVFSIKDGDKYRGADKSLARPGRKQATATEDFDVHISYL